MCSLYKWECTYGQKNRSERTAMPVHFEMWRKRCARAAASMKILPRKTKRYLLFSSISNRQKYARGPWFSLFLLYFPLVLVLSIANSLFLSFFLKIVVTYWKARNFSPSVCNLLYDGPIIIIIVLAVLAFSFPVFRAVDFGFSESNELL